MEGDASLSALLRKTADAIDAGRHFSASLVAQRVLAHPVPNLVDALPDDVLELIVRQCVSPARPSVALRWRDRLLAFGGRRAGAVLEAVVPRALDAMRSLVAERQRLVATGMSLARHMVVQERLGVGVAFRLVWTDGRHEYVWFVDEPHSESVLRQKLQTQFRSILTETEVLAGILPKSLAMHASVCRSRYAQSPFALSDTFCILWRDSRRVIRWIDRDASRLVFLRK